MQFNFWKRGIKIFLNRIQIFIIILITHILLPVGLLISLLLIGDRNIYLYGIYFIFIGNLLWIMYKAGSWEFTFFSLRWIYLLLWGVIGSYVLFCKRILEALTNVYRFSGRDVILILLGIIANIVLAYLHFRIYQSVHSAGNNSAHKILNLRFPCQNGTYLITDGGDGRISSFINYHYKGSIHGKNNTSISMRFAVDIVKLGKGGRTLKNILSKNNKSYEIYNEKVYSPMEGFVVDIKNDIEDNDPFPVKLPYNVGNRVVIKNDIYYIVIGHLQRGSVLVNPGDIVKAGTELGKVGNSGLTPRPHIHMQISRSADGDYWSGDGVPVSFDDNFIPIKNYKYII